MKRAAAPLRALAGGLAALLLAGCSSLPFLNDDESDKAAAAREPEISLYRFDVAAPAPLRTLLLDYLDLVVHVQHSEDRAYYALERLWRDCPLVDFAMDPVPAAEVGS